MNVPETRFALRLGVDFRLATALVLKSGLPGEFTDSSIERTPDGRLHVNGYVWASLLRRALARVGSDELAAKTGAYPDEKTRETGVSPLWCDAGMVDLPGVDIRPGNRIHRKWGSVASGAFYSDEAAPAGLKPVLNAVVFCRDKDEAETWREQLLIALQAVHLGLENIGGHWSYGMGRLEVLRARTRLLDLTQAAERRLLWATGMTEWDADQTWTEPAWTELESGRWAALTVKAGVAPGQLLAVSTDVPPLELEGYGLGETSKLPDTFVFEERWINPDGEAKSRFVIPGKAFRQAVLSQALERKWRSRELTVCHGGDKTPKNCDCPRCRWFGNTAQRGLIAVLDAEVKNPDAVLLNRIQLCEHSMQNMNLFSGAYLRAGEFTFRVIVDLARAGAEGRSILQEITALCKEMQPDGQAPPGWYRLGKTTTCTGQVEVRELKLEGGAAREATS